MQYTLAIAEDEPDLLEVLEDWFSRAGFAVIAATDAASLRRAVADSAVHLALLDITMPGEDGLSLAQWLKSRGPVGLIFATALGRPIDRVVGLDLGADDYVVKPYDLHELLARVKGVLRRIGTPLTATAPRAPSAEPDPALRLGGLRLDPQGRSLIDAKAAATPLSSADFAVLHLLCTRRGQVVTRAALAEAADPNAPAAPGDRAIDIRITRLRRKLAGLDPAAAALLTTVRGEGYCLQETPTT